MKLVLDVGSNGPDFPLPHTYDGWTRVRLDIDEATKPDYLVDARDVGILERDYYDAIYMGHVIEHFTRKDAMRVLVGSLRVLKDGGRLEIRCPDIGALMRRVMAHGMDIEDFLYQSNAGPIRPVDVLFGYQPEIEASGKDYMAHRYGYTERSLTHLLQETGFTSIVVECAHLELIAFAHKERIQ